jgi:hypothetical protein
MPSFDASTPVPAIAVVTPPGKRTGGQAFKHVAVQAVLLAAKA